MGLGIIFGLSLLLTFLTKRNYFTFGAWLFAISGLATMGGLIDTWAFILAAVAFAMLACLQLNISLIGTTVGIMLFLSLIFFVAGTSFADTSIEGLVDVTALNNGTTSSYKITGGTGIFFFDPTQGAIVLIVSVLGVAALVGFNAIGSGLNETSSKAVVYLLFYLGIWFLVSVAPFGTIVGIPYIGILLYSVLTLGYAYGVIKKYLEK